MERYEHGGDIYTHAGVQLDFSVNTNPLGMPEAVRRALICRVDDYVRYPDPQCRELVAAIAFHESVPENWVLCGNGAADLIYRLCYATRPRRALVCAPAFSEYERALEQTGCQVFRHIMAEETHFTLTEEIIARIVPGVDMLFLCHPNNPTGRLIQPDLMERILTRARQTRTMVVADECFLEFTDGRSAKRHLHETPGLVILKAFTKMYAMAGLRLGYLLCADGALLCKVTAAAQCWSVSVPAQIAGVAALACGGWPEETRSLIEKERCFLFESLSRLGAIVFPSDANFLLLRSQRPLYAPLLQKGILVRSCENFIGLSSLYCRVGVKTRMKNNILVQAVEEVLYG